MQEFGKDACQQDPIVDKILERWMEKSQMMEIVQRLTVSQT